MNNKTNKILITGALGTVGSRLIRNLSKEINQEVILLDNFESKRYSSIFNLPKSHKFKFIKADLMSDDFSKHLSGVDIVIHLANTNFYEGHTSGTERLNFIKLKKVADACLAKNVKLFFPSTTSVYVGSNSIVSETSQNINPQSPHAKSKYQCEKYLEKLGKKGLKFTICRLGTAFGFSQGMRFDTAVNKFILQAVMDEPVTVWRTAWLQKRPYLYIGDYIQAINFIIENNLFDGQKYNVISGNFTVEEIIKQIKLFLPKLKVIYIDSPIMNSFSLEVDDEKIQNLGFRTSDKIELGIKEVIEQLKGVIHDYEN